MEKKIPSFSILYSLFSILLLSFLLTSCGDPVQEKILELDSKVTDLQSRVDELEAQVIIKEVEKETGTSEDKQTEGTETTNTLSEYPFESCKAIAEYSTDGWYNGFKQTFEKNFPIKENDLYFPNFAKLSQACYSSEGKTLVAIQPAVNMNAGFHIYKYDISANKITEAYVTSGGLTSFVTPIEFGRRNGNVINMFGLGEENACKVDTSFQYNYIENTLYLKESCSKCEGQDKKCSSY